MSVQVTPIR